MSYQVTDAIFARLQQVAPRYHRLVLVVGPAGAGKTNALEAVRKRTGAPLANLGLELSRRMLELTLDQRPLQLRPFLEQLLETLDEGGGLVLLDNTELLFDATLKQEPLSLLQGLSRNKTVVAAWTGVLEDGKLRYAAPGHPEHRQYPPDDLRSLAVVNLQADDEAP